MKNQTKEVSLMLRLSTAQKKLFTRAAKKGGLGLSAWLRRIAQEEVDFPTIRAPEVFRVFRSVTHRVLV